MAPVAELDIHLDVLPFRDGEQWKVRLAVLSGPDFRSPHKVLGGICPDRETADRVATAVTAALVADPPRLEDGVVIVDVPTLLELGEGQPYPEV